MGQADGRPAITRSAQWFESCALPIFATVHRPEHSTSVRGLVVLCPSMGQEQVFAHRTQFAIADDLASQGFVAVRFDLHGTGDSPGEFSDPDRVKAWLDSIETAVDLGRRHTAAPLSLLGFRAGALLAVQAAARPGFDDVAALVLWDCPRSGRQHLRQLTMEQNVSVGGASLQADGFSGLGLHLDSATRDEFSALRIPRDGVLPASTVVAITDPDMIGLPDNVTTSSGQPIERLEALDQDDMLVRRFVAETVRTTVVDWFDRTFTAGHTLYPAPTDTRRDHRIGQARESLARLHHDLVGIWTVPDHRRATTTVVFVPDSITPRTGLGRAWTELARWLADRGIASLRFDLSGCGDSPARPGHGDNQMGHLAHLDDVDAALMFANSADPSDAIVVGLCSGGYLATEAALAHRVRGLVAINPVYSFVTAEPRPSRRRKALILSRLVPRLLFGWPAGYVARRLSHNRPLPSFMYDPNFRWERAFEAALWQAYLTDKAPWIPDRVWRVLNRIFATQVSDRILRTLHRQGTAVKVIGGQLDYERATLGAQRQIAALQASGGVEVDHLPDLDHAMMRPGAKDDVLAAVSRFITSTVDVGQAPADLERAWTRS